ncbi:MAG TPA: class I mannose-6-phosphate isomerase [Bacteroidales bacterium]|nr:class I mannose-6-phosphate isomerase [Bacteroidales bacterium]HSA44894.1 class I mannose-6-phosphate isomerase [Bacteroidales bacterium]
MRKTAQVLLPVLKPEAREGAYDIYPVHPLGGNQISGGYQSLAEEMARRPAVALDGYAGVFFEEIREGLQECFDKAGRPVRWVNTAMAMKPPQAIEAMTAAFLGGDDPLFGTRTTLLLKDFFDPAGLEALKGGQHTGTCTVFYGCGAALAAPDCFLVYVDLPKNELQYRLRAGTAATLGGSSCPDFQTAYKRLYFVDWVVLNAHKQAIIERIDIFADGQRPGELVWAKGQSIRQALHEMSRSVFRVRPWFEPGPWGGSWCLHHIEGLNKDVPNIAWSFELIVPENGLLFESAGRMMEVSFDCLMFREAPAVLGDAYERFGTEFPIRFDFLDTFEGGNLSVQCHPGAEYTKKHFNEAFTQEECYYILDAGDDAKVYLGFRDEIDPQQFEQVLKKSQQDGTSVNIDHFVNSLNSEKHDFFLIPPGTIHASGRNNMVLEISSTPYIFTFKMYDWLRPGLDGKPRNLNIDRAMENLDFTRKGSYPEEKLRSRPILREAGEGWKRYELPTHEQHFYEVGRLHLRGSVSCDTGGLCRVMNLVEGTSVAVETPYGSRSFNYAETFVIPAATGIYRLINLGPEEAIIVIANVKPSSHL